jgi:hypothetical protein
VKIGPDGNCNGGGVCNAGGASASVAAGYVCSAGSEVSGTCNSVWACSNAQNTDNAYDNSGLGYWTQGYCDGSSSCDRSGSQGEGDTSTASCSCVQSSSGYWSLGGEVASTSCCGDDSGEYKRAEVQGTDAPTAFDDGTDACCNANTKCVEADTCYSSGSTVGSIPNRSYCNSGSWQGGDAGSTQCGAVVSSGRWAVGGDVASAACCGDDSGEYYLSRLAAASMDGGYVSTSSDDACCDASSDCVDDSGCYASGSVSRDADSDSDNDYCNSGSWYDCSTNSQCGGSTPYCSSGDCVQCTLDSQCGLCQKCSGGVCVNQASGEDTKSECPGSYGTCAGSSCNGAGACQYLSSGKQGCGTCQYCTGSSFACSNVAADADTYGDCTGNCDECNGAGACRADNTKCSGTIASCSCSGSGISYNCQSCPDSYGVCGDATCSSYACGNSAYAAGTNCGGVCQSCNGAGSCINTASGGDYQNECPGSYGTCAAATCNGAGACGYLAAGQQGCGTCNYCTGSSFSCSVAASGTDPYNACTASWNGCSGTCVKTGPDGNCNGASACNTGGASANCGSNTYCVSGSCNSGACNTAWHCNGATNYQYTCNGAGSCSTEYNGDTCSGDCSCTCAGYGTTESTASGNCGDGLDNDCDGYADASDAGCEDCSCTGSGYETKTVQGQTLYVQCSDSYTDVCWTPGTTGTYTWGPIGVTKSSCIGAGSSYPACNYCDTLNYAGYSDWVLAATADLQRLFANTNICVASSASCFGGATRGYYQTWTSTGISTGYARGKAVQHPTTNYDTWPRNVDFYINCVRYGS